MKKISSIIWVWIAFSLFACNLPLIPVGPTVTPSITLTPSPIPTSTPTLTPSPTPTPNPIVRLSEAEQALFYGNYERARAEFRAAFADSNDKDIQANALLGLARVEYADSRYAAALTRLKQLMSDFPESQQLAHANFLLGKTLAAISRYQEAANAYRNYLTLRPGVIDSYTQELIGDALSAAGDYSGALAAYQSALQAPRLDDNLQLEIKIAIAQIEIEDYTTALTLLDSIAERSPYDTIKAQMDYLAGQAYLSLGQTENSYSRYLHAVENYKNAYYSYLALIELVNAGIQVNEFDRGLIDYNVEQYDVALAAFDRFLKANPDNDGTVHYYRALTFWALDQAQEALDELSLFISNYPDNPNWSKAWDYKADIQWLDLGNNKAAAQTLIDFVQAVPAHTDAPSFLLSAGRIMERADQLEDAAALWERLANEYPGSELVPQSLFLAGIARYRVNDFSQALTSFQRSLILSGKPEDQARAYLWIGKTQQKLGDQTAVQTAWQQAQALDPTGYYSERARDLLIGRAPFEAPPFYNPVIDPTKERAEAAAWLRVSFNLPVDTDLGGPGPLLEDARMQRGTELWELGLYDEARLEFENLREVVKENPADSFRLANYLLDLGLYRTAIFAARQVLTLAGLEDHSTSFRAPAYFNHIRYGLYYDEIIIPAAQDNGFHPLFLFSVVRQESLFEGFVRSTAGARGLMQIIPSTGASIAKNIGWPVGFTPDDLYRPIVSIKLGARYLKSNRNLFDRSDYAALAAYNAGPGNAMVWNERAGNDPDLFLEVIRYEETRQYIRYIYEIYETYRKLYSPTP